MECPIKYSFQNWKGNEIPATSFGGATFEADFLGDSSWINRFWSAITR
jgi:hypothetical protein